MKRLLSLAAVLPFLVTNAVHAQAPSSIFNQEMARVIGSGDINLDLYNSGGNTLRIGAFSGEMIADLTLGTLGFKKGLSRSVAAYGALGITTDATGTSTNTVVLGGVYTHQSNKVILNFNPVLTNAAGTSTVVANFAAFIPMETSRSHPGRIYPGVSVALPLSPSGDAIILLGMRWEIKSNITVEAGLYDSTTGVQIPGLFRINIGF